MFAIGLARIALAAAEQEAVKENYQPLPYAL